MDWLVKLFCILLTPQVVVSVCSSGWISDGLYCYFFSDVNATFEEADQSCVALQAQLTDISDNSENSYLFTRTAEKNQQSYWIGYEEVVTGIWRWKATGTAGLFNRWDIAEPDGEGKCTRLTPFNDGAWRDFPCEGRLKYICKKFAECGAPLEMPHATRELSHSELILSAEDQVYHDGTNAHYTCSDGYEYPDESLTKTLTCEIGGVWRPDVTVENTCKPKKCTSPPVYNHQQLNTTGNEYYDFGTVISYTCDDGYWFGAYEASVNHKYLTCEGDKQWRGDAINHCSQMHCIRPVTANSAANTSSNAFGTIATYTCNVGFSFRDKTKTKTFRCGTRTWEPLQETCNALRCPENPVIGATPSTEEVIYDTYVIWTCNKGMLYPDTSTRKSMRCLETEQWDFPITASCQKKKCMQEPPNATETSTRDWDSTRSYSYQDTVTYTCKYDEWTFPSKEPKVTREVECGPDGEWLPQNVGECTGEPIIIVEDHPTAAPKESKNAEVVGSLGLIICGATLLGVVLLDLTTIGKHLSMMRNNLCPPQEDKKVLVSDKAKKWKKNLKQNPQTSIKKAKTEEELGKLHEVNEKRSPPRRQQL